MSNKNLETAENINGIALVFADHRPHQLMHFHAFHLHGGLPLDTLSSQSENVSNELRRKKKLQTTDLHRKICAPFPKYDQNRD